MTNEKATEDNYLDILDSMNCMEALELVHGIMFAFEQEYQTFDIYALEKPWKFPEIYVPALNGELDGRVSECLQSVEEN